MEPDLGFVNLRELAQRAKARVDPVAYDYVAGGAGDERTLASNESGWGRWKLVHRVLRDVSRRDTSTTVLGTKISFPVLAAPTAFHRLMHPEGEAGTARGVAEAGTLMVASTLSTMSLEDIAQASSGPKWFQLYVYRDRALTESLVKRAKGAGYNALVLTVDAPTWGRRERDVRNGFRLPPGMGLANFPDLQQERLPAADRGDALAAYIAAQLDSTLTWDTIDWLRNLSGLPVVVKGLVHPDDALEAVRHGARGVVVSNHGGRQLDAGISTIDALPGVARAVGDSAEVYVDGGVRRGTDVAIALALGARAVLVGRPLLWSLALAGGPGVARGLGLLRDEFHHALGLLGAKSPSELGPAFLAERRS